MKFINKLRLLYRERKEYEDLLKRQAKEIMLLNKIFDHKEDKIHELNIKINIMKDKAKWSETNRNTLRIRVLDERSYKTEAYHIGKETSESVNGIGLYTGDVVEVYAIRETPDSKGKKELVNGVVIRKIFNSLEIAIAGGEIIRIQSMSDDIKKILTHFNELSEGNEVAFDRKENLQGYRIIE